MKRPLSRIKNDVSHRNKYFILAYAVLITAVFISFFNTFGGADLKPSGSVYEKVKALVNEAQLNDRELVHEAIVMHNAPFPGFDKVSKLRNSLSEGLSSIKSSQPLLINEAQSLQVLISEYSNALDSRLVGLDAYLAQYKSFKATKKYVPVAKKELLSEMRSAKVENFDMYKSLVNQIYTDVQQFLQTPDETQKTILFTTLDRYQEKLARISVPVVGLTSFISQSRALVEAKLSSLSMLQKFSEPNHLSVFNDIQSGLDVFIQSGWLENRQASVGAFLTILIGFCLFSLASLVWFIFSSAKPSAAPLTSETHVSATLEANNDEDFIDENISSSLSVKNNSDVGMAGLATILAHQLKTPINYIRENVETLRPILKDVHNALNELDDHAQLNNLPMSLVRLVRSKKVSEFPFVVDEINEGVSSVHDVLESVRALTDKKSPERINLDVNSLVRQSIKMKQKALRADINFKVDFDDTPGVFRGVSIDVINAINYVIDNAVEAVNDNLKTFSSISISTLIQDKSVKIMIRDNGVGIEKSDIKRIYEPFFGNKESSENLGMGLTYAKQNVERHGGRINIVPGIDSGTLVRISFPLLEVSDFNQYIVSEELVDDNDEAKITNDEALDLERIRKVRAKNQSKIRTMKNSSLVAGTKINHGGSIETVNSNQKNDGSPFVIKKSKKSNVSLFADSDELIKSVKSI